jgi:hypothetical protein
MYDSRSACRIIPHADRSLANRDTKCEVCAVEGLHLSCCLPPPPTHTHTKLTKRLNWTPCLLLISENSRFQKFILNYTRPDDLIRKKKFNINIVCSEPCYVPYRSQLFSFNRSVHHCGWLIWTHTPFENIQFLLEGVAEWWALFTALPGSVITADLEMRDRGVQLLMIHAVTANKHYIP